MMTAFRPPERKLEAFTAGVVLCGFVVFSALSLAGIASAQESAPTATLSVETVPENMPENPPVLGDVIAPASDGTINVLRQNVDNTALLDIAEAKSRLRDATVLPDALQTLFYTAWQHALLQEAKKGFNARLPDPGELSAGENAAPRERGIRELWLGGIAYGAGSKWTVWLNGVRITPDAIPPQVMDIKVSRTYIDLKWFDGYTNKIYPVRMRPHERFNLDSRIFLPGTPAGAF